VNKQYIQDVEPLQKYIESELNVRSVVFSSDESSSGLRYRAVADWTVLGRKLKKDVSRVRTALPEVPSDKIKEFLDTGKLTVDGNIELVTGDITVQRYLDIPADAQKQFATNTDNDVVVRLDILVHPELVGEWLARELTNRVQKLRKKAGLQATDDVHVFYRFEEGSGKEIVDAIGAYSDMIRKTVGNVPSDVSSRAAGSELLIEEEQEVSDVKFLLYLVKP
jgi:isoleucyl-tRNA synthetase